MAANSLAASSFVRATVRHPGAVGATAAPDEQLPNSPLHRAKALLRATSGDESFCTAQPPVWFQLSAIARNPGDGAETTEARFWTAETPKAGETAALAVP